MNRLPKLSKLGYCCFLLFSLALASILVYITASQGIDITHKIDQVDKLQQTSITQLTCLQICRNQYVSYGSDKGESCCSNDMLQNCVYKHICKDDYVASQKMEIKCMLSDLYFECGFLAFIAVTITVFMCYKWTKRRQQEQMMAANNNNLQQRIHSILERMNNCNEPLIVGSKEQLNPSHFAQNMSETCPVCLQEFQERKVITLNCRHVFHSLCIEQWITHNARCPVCRTKL